MLRHAVRSTTILSNATTSSAVTPQSTLPNSTTSTTTMPSSSRNIPSLQTTNTAVQTSLTASSSSSSINTASSTSETRKRKGSTKKTLSSTKTSSAQKKKQKSYTIDDTDEKIIASGENTIPITTEDGKKTDLNIYLLKDCRRRVLSMRKIILGETEHHGKDKKIKQARDTKVSGGVIKCISTLNIPEKAFIKARSEIPEVKGKGNQAQVYIFIDELIKVKLPRKANSFLRFSMQYLIGIFNPMPNSTPFSTPANEPLAIPSHFSISIRRFAEQNAVAPNVLFPGMTDPELNKMLSKLLPSWAFIKVMKIKYINLDQLINVSFKESKLYQDQCSLLEKVASAYKKHPATSKAHERPTSTNEITSSTTIITPVIENSAPHPNYSLVGDLLSRLPSIPPLIPLVHCDTEQETIPLREVPSTIPNLNAFVLPPMPSSASLNLTSSLQSIQSPTTSQETRMILSSETTLTSTPIPAPVLSPGPTPIIPMNTLYQSVASDSTTVGPQPGFYNNTPANISWSALMGQILNAPQLCDLSSVLSSLVLHAAAPTISSHQATPEMAPLAPVPSTNGPASTKRKTTQTTQTTQAEEESKKSEDSQKSKKAKRAASVKEVSRKSDSTTILPISPPTADMLSFPWEGKDIKVKKHSYEGQKFIQVSELLKQTHPDSSPGKVKKTSLRNRRLEAIREQFPSIIILDTIENNTPKDYINLDKLALISFSSHLSEVSFLLETVKNAYKPPSNTASSSTTAGSSSKKGKKVPISNVSSKIPRGGIITKIDIEHPITIHPIIPNDKGENLEKSFSVFPCISDGEKAICFKHLVTNLIDPSKDESTQITTKKDICKRYKIPNLFFTASMTGTAKDQLKKLEYKEKKNNQNMAYIKLKSLVGVTLPKCSKKADFRLRAYMEALIRALPTDVLASSPVETIPPALAADVTINSSTLPPLPPLPIRSTEEIIEITHSGEILPPIAVEGHPICNPMIWIAGKHKLIRVEKLFPPSLFEQRTTICTSLGIPTTALISAKLSIDLQNNLDVPESQNQPREYFIVDELLNITFKPTDNSPIRYVMEALVKNIKLLEAPIGEDSLPLAVSSSSSTLSSSYLSTEANSLATNPYGFFSHSTPLPGILNLEPSLIDPLSPLPIVEDDFAPLEPL